MLPNTTDATNTTQVLALSYCEPGFSVYKVDCLYMNCYQLYFVCTVDPGFYPANWLYIGKSLLQLGRVEEAGEWLRRAGNCQSKLGDDVEASVTYCTHDLFTLTSFSVS